MSKILLVEDDELNQIMLTKRLKKRGFTVIPAQDGQAAVAKARSESPDLILMDLRLPVFDGYEATQRLKADPQTTQIPVIALTADAMVGDEQRALDAGCNAYETKPVNLERLLGLMQTLLEEQDAQ